MQDKDLIEAALFAAGGPVSDAQLKAMLNRSAAYVSELVGQIIADYRSRNSPLEVIRLDGKYVMQLRPEFAGRVMSVSPKELSAPVLRTLSIIAYYQPIFQNELVNIRGDKVYDHVAVLLERGLIDKVKEGRSFKLSTTAAFCDYFGLTHGDVESIKQQIQEKAKLKKQSLTRWIESGVPEFDGFDAVRLLVPVMKE
ncbi:MAG: segregation and condensation protein B [Methanocella sp. PtaU1.Bin125]|nr:MAG: segregation and condensation protein B [Methanocella sp. PtaU1.Bin125]